MYGREAALVKDDNYQTPHGNLLRAGGSPWQLANEELQTTEYNSGHTLHIRREALFSRSFVAVGAPTTGTDQSNEIYSHTLYSIENLSAVCEKKYPGQYPAGKVIIRIH